jgi:hypothetical protein
MPPRLVRSRLPVSTALIAGILAFVLVGCGSSAETTAPGVMPSAFPTHSADEIREFLRRPSDTLEGFEARARMTVRSPDENQSFNAAIRQRRADSLYMRFSLFGFEGGRMLLTPDSIFFYDSRKNTLRVGPVAEARELFPAPVAEDVFANLLGLIAPEPGTDWSVTADTARYHLSNPQETRHWTIDPRRWRVVRYEETTPDGTVTEVRRFSDFRTVEQVSLPHSVVFQRPDEDLMARIEYDEIELNPSGLSFDLGVPSTVPRKPLRGR